MKKSIILGFASFLLVGTAMVAQAAGGATLVNGGFGQRNGDVAQFGFAICNQGQSAFSQAVPVSVNANGITKTVIWTGSLAPKACGYSYVPYSNFNMQAGSKYTITVAIDPNHTVSANTNNQAVYASILVPASGKVLGASVMSAAERTMLLGELAAAQTKLQALLLQLQAMSK